MYYFNMVSGWGFGLGSVLRRKCMVVITKTLPLSQLVLGIQMKFINPTKNVRGIEL
jgi:hypothetical protein